MRNVVSLPTFIFILVYVLALVTVLWDWAGDTAFISFHGADIGSREEIGCQVHLHRKQLVII